MDIRMLKRLEKDAYMYVNTGSEKFAGYLESIQEKTLILKSGDQEYILDAAAITAIQCHESSLER